MITELLEELRTAVSGASGLSESAKAELLGHVTAMESCADKAEAPATGDGAPPSDGEKHPGNHPIDGLVNSVASFEASHPDITALVNRIAVALGNMGI